MSWPERADGWQDALTARARSFFGEIAERHGLRCEWDDSAPVEVACTYPEQPGLEFALSLWLSGDEFGCGGKHWHATIFPADAEQKWADATRMVDELITGEARIALFRALGWKRPYWTEVQLLDNGRWRSISTGLGCAIPPIVRPTIIQNGRGQKSGGYTLARGSLTMLLTITLAIYWSLT